MLEKNSEHRVVTESNQHRLVIGISPGVKVVWLEWGVQVRRLPPKGTLD